MAYTIRYKSSRADLNPVLLLPMLRMTLLILLLAIIPIYASNQSEETYRKKIQVHSVTYYLDHKLEARSLAIQCRQIDQHRLREADIWGYQYCRMSDFWTNCTNAISVVDALAIADRAPKAPAR